MIPAMNSFALTLESCSNFAAAIAAEAPPLKGIKIVAPIATKTEELILITSEVHSGLLLTHNNPHLTVLTGQVFQQTGPTPSKPAFILTFAIVFYIFCILFSILWTRKFKNGPLETLIRKISN